jgi:alanyl-tRNA synthetase
MARKPEAVEEDFTDETEEVSDATTEGTEEKKAKRQKDALEDEWGTPVDFTKVLLAERGVEVRPQVIFGHTKNSKTFQDQAKVKQHTDNRTILHLPSALEWWDAKEQRKADKAAAKDAAPADDTSDEA